MIYKIGQLVSFVNRVDNSMGRNEQIIEKDTIGRVVKQHCKSLIEVEIGGERALVYVTDVEKVKE